MKFDHPIQVAEIADWTQCQIIGNAESKATGLNEIHHTEIGDITFVDHEKYYDFTLQSNASFIIINKKLEAPVGKTLLYHSDPFAVYNFLAAKFHPTLASTKLISDTAEIGAGTQIYPNVFIGEKVKIGKNCIIYPNVSIGSYTEIGDHVIVHPNTTIGKDAFYYKRQSAVFHKMHTAGRTVIKDEVEIGSSCAIDAGVSSDTVIGKRTKIDNLVHIGHDTKIGEDCLLCAQVGISGNVTIGNRVKFYGKSGTVQNVVIPDDVTILGSSNVGKNLEVGKTYLGSPCEESTTVAKQWAIIKQLPSLWEKLRKL